MYDEKCLARIGSNIRFLRMACQVSQQDMAERIGISQTHLSNLEHNHSSVNLKLLLRIANVLECPLEIFLDTNAA
ncbi:helix-turn-helix domain-containing protein, partial [Phascolarctobacterium sp.]